MASHTKGKASPSFKPASKDKFNLVLLVSASSLGGPTCTSEAKTGSVGAKTLMSRRAEAIGISK